MDDYDNHFDTIESAAADRRRQQDFDDLQNELSGTDVGRIARFLSPEARALARGETVDGRRKGELSALDMLLLNPEYARMYQQTMDRLGALERATDMALDDAERAARIAKDEFNDVLERAHTLDDGRRVFRDRDGEVWDEHDQRLDDIAADAIEWRGNEPSHEEFIEKREGLSSADNDVLELREYRTELGATRDQMEDPDFDADDLIGVQERLDADVPDLVKVRFEVKPPETRTPDISTSPDAVNQAMSLIGGVGKP